ncbi:MAG: MBOAT family protein, partial [Dysgonamonadaceae bacterium]|nr:MBOAT family protein [Dysgonamonadaceae bacterium]
LKITQNFNYPLFAQNIADFWRRWHISLTSWLTDYVFMPLNVRWRDWGKGGMILAIIVDFVLCGLWHGANWTFVLWGFYHGLLFIPLILSGAMFKKKKIETYAWGFPKINILGRMLLTFGLVAFGLVLFRAESVGQAAGYLKGLIQLNGAPFSVVQISMLAFFIACMLGVEWIQRNREHGLAQMTKSHLLNFAIYYVLVAVIFNLGSFLTDTFIYFQF